jgi:hypothetical protein
MIKGYLLHLSFNMWADREAPEWGLEHVSARPYLRVDMSLWNDVLVKMVTCGLNTVVIDLGDGIRYDSHPEIAVRGAWSPTQLRDELARIRDMGLEPIPKLNFSACHDVWLGPYARCVSTSTYHDVCRELIAEVCELFDRPALFHLGMDEETAEHQRHYEYVVIRQGDLWWHDLGMLVESVQDAGVRPWIWSDYLWQHPDDFRTRMPRSVLQSNWYYGVDFGPHIPPAMAYLDLEAWGYDQIPTGSSWTADGNMGQTVAFGQRHIAPERLVGFLQTAWKPTLEVCRARHMQALELAGRALSPIE